MIKNLRLRYFGVFVVLALLLTACAAKAELPPAPSATLPLVEYSIDQGKTWHTLAQDEVVRLDANAVQIKQTAAGMVFGLKARGNLGFQGSITKTENTITAKGRGGIVLVVAGQWGVTTNYAKIILE